MAATSVKELLTDLSTPLYRSAISSIHLIPPAMVASGGLCASGGVGHHAASGADDPVGSSQAITRTDSITGGLFPQADAA